MPWDMGDGQLIGSDDISMGLSCSSLNQLSEELSCGRIGMVVVEISGGDVSWIVAEGWWW